MRVIVFGTFDDLHPGHRYLLNEALKKTQDARHKTQAPQDNKNSQFSILNSQLFVIVARDANVQKIKGHAPLQNENTRVENIRKEFPAATVLLGHETDFMARLREIEPDLILLGYDQKLPPGVTEADLGAPVERLEAFEPHIHKSSLRREMREEK